MTASRSRRSRRRPERRPRAATERRRSSFARIRCVAMPRRIAVAVACALGASSAGLVVAAGALAAGVDTASTHSYIRANYAFARATVARIHAAHAKIAVFNARLAHECPSVGKDSPENEASQPMSYEVAVALWSIAYDVDAAPIGAFAKAT